MFSHYTISIDIVSKVYIIYQYNDDVMIKKKGTSEAFKYLLVLFAGITILIFFIRFAWQASGLIRDVKAVDIRETLNDYFNALSSAEDLVTTANINSRVYVNQPDCGKISIGIRRTISNAAEYSHIIFSPAILNERMFVWTKEWNYPFRVGNFFYLISPDTKIFLVGNSKLIDELTGIRKANGACCENSNYIDPRFKVEKKYSVDANFIRDKAKEYNKIIFVFFGEQATTVTGIENARLRSINAIDCEDEKDEEECRGTISFGNNKQSFFAGRPMLYAAIFSEDYQNYECGFGMAKKRLKLVSDIYNGKKMMLERLMPSCSKYGFSIEANYNSLESMYGNMKSLRQSNYDIGGVECAKVF